MVGDRHGSDVLAAVRTIDQRIRYVVANTSLCLREGSSSRNPDCGIRFSNGSFDLGRSSEISYTSISASQLSTVLGRSSRMGAINISYGDRNYTSCPTNLNNTFFQLKSIHKAPVVAATGNGGNRSKVAFPACAPNVISVAATQRQNGVLPPLVSSSAVWNSNTDFFAEGYFVPYDGVEDHD